MGAVVAEEYAKNHTDSVHALVVFGSFIQAEGVNEYPLPFLAAVGSLDGRVMSPFYYEVAETAALPEDIKETSYSISVEDVNHSQVSLKKICFLM